MAEAENQPIVVVSSTADVLNSIKGYVNVAEFVKAVIAGLSTGTGVYAVLASVQASLGAIITDPNTLTNVQDLIKYGASKNWVALGFGVLTLSYSLYTKFTSGSPVIPVIVPPSPVTPVVPPVVVVPTPVKEGSEK